MDRPGRNLRQKMIKELRTSFRESAGLFISRLEGLTNKELEDLRSKLNTVSSNFIVVKNTMCKLALKELKMDKLCSFLEGTSAVSVSSSDIVETSKVLVNFGKHRPALKIQAGFSDNQILSVDTIKELASLPPKNILLGKLVQTINSPISGFVYAVNGVVNKFVYVLEAIRKKKE